MVRDQLEQPTGRAQAAPRQEGRRERRKRELREHIYTVARDLFVSQGVDMTTVEQIANVADIAPATFFNHFQSKQAVVEEMTHEVVGHLQRLLTAELTRANGTRQRLIDFADAAAADIEQARAIARDVVLTFVRTESRPGEPSPYLDRVHEPFTEILLEGQAKGEVRTDQEASFLAEMVVGIFNATVTGWLADPRYPIEKRFRQAAVFAWESVQSRPAAGRERRT
jgi:AcrR family transcriptional regulator